MHTTRLLPWIVLALAGCSTAAMPDVGDDDDDGGKGDIGEPVAACALAERTCGMWELDGAMTDCGGCGDGMACNTEGACEATDDSAGVMGVITLVHRSNLYDNLATKLASTASAEFSSHAPMPPDARQVFTTEDGERCYVETTDVYPSWVDGAHWPPRPLTDVGTLTIDAATAPGPVELEPLATSTLGALYRLTDSPGPLTSGTSTFADYFEAGYLPGGQPYSIAVAGNGEVPAFEIMAGTIPPAPTGFEPAILREAEIGDRPSIDLEEGQPIRVSWTPTPGDHRIEIEYNAYTSTDELRLRCDAADDGELLIPFEPVKTYFLWSTTTMFFRRHQRRTLHPIPGNDQVAITVDASNEVLGLVFTKP